MTVTVPVPTRPVEAHELDEFAAVVHRCVLADVRLLPCLEGIDLSILATTHLRLAQAALKGDLVGADTRAPDGGWYSIQQQEWLNKHLLRGLRRVWPMP